MHTRVTETTEKGKEVIPTKAKNRRGSCDWNKVLGNL